MPGASSFLLLELPARLHEVARERLSIIGPNERAIARRKEPHNAVTLVEELNDCVLRVPIPYRSAKGSASTCLEIVHDRCERGPPVKLEALYVHRVSTHSHEAAEAAHE